MAQNTSKCNPNKSHSHPRIPRHHSFHSAHSFPPLLLHPSHSPASTPPPPTHGSLPPHPRSRHRPAPHLHTPVPRRRPSLPPPAAKPAPVDGQALDAAPALGSADARCHLHKDLLQLYFTRWLTFVFNLCASLTPSRLQPLLVPALSRSIRGAEPTGDELPAPDLPNLTCDSGQVLIFLTFSLPVPCCVLKRMSPIG